jgi:hypothetical protein
LWLAFTFNDNNPETRVVLSANTAKSDGQHNLSKMPRAWGWRYFSRVLAKGQ